MDYLERRAALRDAHRKHVQASVEQGELSLGRAFANPADGAAIVFSGDSPAVATAFAEADPYVRNGLVTRWWVREWTIVAGFDAAQPVAMPDGPETHETGKAQG